MRNFDGRDMHCRRVGRSTLLDRAAHLSPGDRALVEQVIGRGVPATEVAKLTGRSARSVQRRVQRLVGRLADPRTARLLRECPHWNAVDRQVAMSLYLRGRSLKRTAGVLEMSFYEVRRRADAVRVLIGQGTGDRSMTNDE